MTDREADRLAMIFCDAYEAGTASFSYWTFTDEGRARLRDGVRAVADAVAEALAQGALQIPLPLYPAYEEPAPVDLSYVKLMRPDDCRPAGMRVQNDVFEY